jgi:hypothetical protein
LKKFAGIVILILGGCVVETGTRAADPRGVYTPPAKSSQELEVERNVQADFEAWKKSTVEGDFKSHLAGMTAGFVSDWVWRRTLSETDRRWPKWAALMPAQFKIDFEYWLKENNSARRSGQRDRATQLPDALLASRWLQDCYLDYFKADLEVVKVQLMAGQVTGVAVEQSGATVISRLPGPTTEYWAMAVGVDGHWRVDGYVKPGR